MTGFNKHSRISQAEIDLSKADLELSDTKKYFSTSLEKANRDYETNSIALYRQKQNVDLARNILSVSNIKFGEGTITMSEFIDGRIQSNRRRAKLFEYKTTINFIRT